MHEIVVNQLWMASTRNLEAAQRLLAQGYDRHAVLHMLAEVAQRSRFGRSTTALGDRRGPQCGMRAGMAALGRQVAGAYRKTSDAREANAPIPIASRRKHRPPN